MPTITGPVTADGALVTVAIGVSEARRRRLLRFNFPVPPPAKIRALVDPGSYVTLADTAALQHLGVTSYASQPLLSAASGHMVHLLPVYYLSVTLLDAADQPIMYWPHVTVYATAYAPTDAIHAIIGRDLLADCTFIYDGMNGVFSLTV